MDYGETGNSRKCFNTSANSTNGREETDELGNRGNNEVTKWSRSATKSRSNLSTVSQNSNTCDYEGKGKHTNSARKLFSKTCGTTPKEQQWQKKPIQKTLKCACSFKQQCEGVTPSSKKYQTAANNYRENFEKAENSVIINKPKKLSNEFNTKRVELRESCIPFEKSTSGFMVNGENLTFTAHHGNAKMSLEESTENDQKAGNRRRSTSTNVLTGNKTAKSERRFNEESYYLEPEDVYDSLQGAGRFKREPTSPTCEKQVTHETQFILVCPSITGNRKKIINSIREELRLANVVLLPQGTLTESHLLIFLSKSSSLKIFTVTAKDAIIKLTITNHECGVQCSDPELSNGARCLCEEILSKLEKVLQLLNVRFTTLKVFEENAFLRDADGFKSIDYGFVNNVQELELKMDNTASLLEEICFDSKETCIKETLEYVTASSSLSRIAKLRSDYKAIVSKFFALEDELRAASGVREGETHEVKKLDDRDNQETGDSAFKTHEGNLWSAHPESNPEIRIAYTQLLEIIAKSLTPEDWVTLREELSYDLPSAGLGHLQNGVEILHQLHKIKVIDEDHPDFIRKLFYSIERVDLVHVIDCYGEGDHHALSCLNELVHNQTFDASTKKKTRCNEKKDLNEISSPVADSCPREPAPVAHYSREMQEGVFTSSGAACTTNHILHPATLAKEHCEDISASGEKSANNPENYEHPTVSCEHYDRFCTAKFSCCTEFWACHRCHNAKSNCGKKKLKSLDIESIKCNRCGKIQQFPKERPHCVQCDLKFADYFCPICKHLTGTSNDPYHCKECGICRVNRNKSFHCKICGFCMDICLKGNHKCRANSAHDSCFICLEDAFTGCQILPCSHKVHKDCAQTMIRRGITKCPVCRESFAHKMNRRAFCK